MPVKKFENYYTCGEYLQMSGHRGKDAKGIFFLKPKYSSFIFG